MLELPCGRNADTFPMSFSIGLKEGCKETILPYISVPPGLDRKICYYYGRL